MRKIILVVLAFVLLMPFVSRSSEAKAQTYIDSMVTSSINTRRREYVYKSRKNARKKRVVRKKKPVRKNVRKKVVRRKRSRG